MNEPKVVPPGQLTLIDKKLVLNAIIDAVSRIPGFAIVPQPNQPPDDPVPPGSVASRIEAAMDLSKGKKLPGWPKGKKRKKKGGKV